MRIIILLPADHLYANLVVKEIIMKSKGNSILVGESATIIQNLSFLQSIKKYIKVCGFYYFFVQSLKQILFKLGKFFNQWVFFNEDEQSLFFCYKRLIGKFDFKIAKVIAINNLKNEEIIKDFKPDLIISIFFREILNEKILKIPQKGCINIHPSLLPDYRGVSPIFWALSRSEKRTGVTVHFMDREIDKGFIISQGEIAVRNNDSEHRIFLECAKKGASFLLEALQILECGTGQAIESNIAGGRYFSLPTRVAVRDFKKKGFSFFKLQDFF